MITVHNGQRPDVRVDLPEGAHILFKAAATAGKQSAKIAMVKALGAGEDEAVASVAWTVALARWGLISWEGIVDDATGEALEATRDNLDLLLEQRDDVFEAVDRQYAIPALETEREKNGSAPSPHGTSPESGAAKPARALPSAAGTTAKPARRRVTGVPST